MGQDNREDPVRRRKLELPPDMTEEEFHQLASYNGYVGEGLVHTDAWKAKMAVLQERWDRWVREHPPR